MDTFIFYSPTNKIDELINESPPSVLIDLTPNVVEEIKITELIKQIPKWERHYQVFTDIEKLVYSCNYKKKEEKKEEAIKLHITYPVPTLELSEYLDTLPNSNVYMNQIIHLYTSLLNRISGLLSKRVCHANIQFDTICVDEFETLSLRDFSHAILTESNLHIAVELNVFVPIENHIYNYLLENKLNNLSQFHLITVVNRVYDAHPIIEDISDSLLQTFKSAAIEYYSKWIDKVGIANIRQELMSKCIWTRDNYSASCVFLFILVSIKNTLANPNKFIVLFIKLLLENIHPNYERRKTVAVSLASLHKLLEETEIKYFNSLLEEMQIKLPE